MKNFILLAICTLWFSGLSAQNVERYKTYHDKGRTLILKGDYKNAIHNLDTAILIMPYYSAIFQDRGYAQMQLKNYTSAIQDFNHVLDKKPYLDEVRLQRGMALYHLNRLMEAEDDLIQVVNSTPTRIREATIYLDNIQKEKQIITQNLNRNELNKMRIHIENERVNRARHREEIIWGTVVPLAFWTSVFLCW